MGAVGEAIPYVLPALVCAAVDWYAVANEKKWLEYITKPLTMLALIGAVLVYTWGPEVGCVLDPPRDCLEGPGISDRHSGLVVAALVFSLAGDVFLMLPRNLFVAGLASFLGAHVSYIIAFQPSANAREPLVIGTLLVLLIAGAIVYSQLRKGMVAKGKAMLIPAVLIYIIAISQMVASAVANNVEPDFPQPQAAIGAAGALLFYVSDALIGWTRFVKDFAWSPVAIHATYHLAQIGIVLSFVR